MPFNNIENEDRPFLDALKTYYPHRFQTGVAGAFTVWKDGVMADAVHQLGTDMSLFPFVSHPNSPPDYLQIAARNEGIIRFLGEPENIFRSRLVNKWSLVPNFGTEGALVDAITETLGGPGFVNVSLLFDLSVNVSPVPGPKGEGPPILPYSASTAHPSQFAVTIDINQPLFQFPDINTQSDLMSDIQLDAVRQIIGHIKPAQWVCREINLRSFNLVYNAENLLWNSASLEWLDNASISGSIERHGAYY